MSYQVKITVIKRNHDPELVECFLNNPETGKCSVFHEGQEFYVTRENYDNFPYENKFCVAAWDVIKIKVYAVLQGGNFYWKGWMRDQQQQILCCDDGVRPVVFLLEQIEMEDK